MNRTTSDGRRAQELRAIILTYWQTTADETQATACGDTQIEIEDELWKLEQELYDPRLRRQA